MKKNLELIHQVNYWLHYIGSYYSSPEIFIKEAMNKGISRRLPAQIVRGIHFGDVIYFARYVSNGGSYIFGEGIVTELIFDKEISKAIGEELINQGKAQFNPPAGGEPQRIERECGSYIIIGSYSVSCEIEDILNIAEKIAAEKQIKLFVMLGIKLNRTYPDPRLLPPEINFTRTLIKLKQWDFICPNLIEDKHITSIDNYMRR